jgi:hypothetical protein
MEQQGSNININSFSDTTLNDYFKEIEIKYFTEEHKKEIDNHFHEIQFEYTNYITIGMLEDLCYYSYWQDDESFNLLIDKLKSEEYNINFWRRVKGDGNCYYRAVLYQYLEIIISLCIKEQNVDKLICLIRDIIIHKFDKDREKYRKKTISIICYIIDYIRNKKFSEASLFFNKVYNTIDLFEKTLIFWLRMKLMNFLKSNLNLEINGMKLLNLLPGFEYEDDNSFDQSKIDNYISKELMKMNEYVEGYPLYITPILLKLDIDIYHVEKKEVPDLNDEKKTNFFVNKYCLKKQYDKSDELNGEMNHLFDIPSDLKIKVMFRSQHYECLYTLTDKVNLGSSIDLNILEIEKFSKDDYSNYKNNILDNISLSKKETRGSLAGILSSSGQKNGKGCDINKKETSEKLINIKEDHKKNNNLININKDVETSVNEENEKINNHQEESNSDSINQQMVKCDGCNTILEFSEVLQYPCKIIECMLCMIFKIEMKLNNISNNVIKYVDKKKWKYSVEECNSSDEVIKQLNNRDCKNLECNCNKDYVPIQSEVFKNLIDKYLKINDKSEDKLNNFENKTDKKNLNKKTINCLLCKCNIYDSKILNFSCGHAICFKCFEKDINYKLNRYGYQNRTKKLINCTNSQEVIYEFTIRNLDSYHSACCRSRLDLDELTNNLELFFKEVENGNLRYGNESTKFNNKIIPINDSVRSSYQNNNYHSNHSLKDKYNGTSSRSNTNYYSYNKDNKIIEINKINKKCSDCGKEYNENEMISFKCYKNFCMRCLNIRINKKNLFDKSLKFNSKDQFMNILNKKGLDCICCSKYADFEEKKEKLCDSCSLENASFSSNICQHNFCDQCIINMTFEEINKSYKKMKKESFKNFNDIKMKIQSVKCKECKNDKKGISIELFSEIFKNFFFKSNPNQSNHNHLDSVHDQKNKEEKFSIVSCSYCKKETQISNNNIMMQYSCGHINCYSCLETNLTNILNYRDPLKNKKNNNQNYIDLKGKYHPSKIRNHFENKRLKRINCPNCRSDGIAETEEVIQFLNKIKNYEECEKCLANQLVKLKHGCKVCPDCQKEIIFHENKSKFLLCIMNEMRMEFLNNTCIKCEKIEINYEEKQELYGGEILNDEINKVLKIN